MQECYRFKGPFPALFLLQSTANFKFANCIFPPIFASPFAAVQLQWTSPFLGEVPEWPKGAVC